MLKFALGAGLGAFLACIASPGYAQVATTYVSSTGTGATCSRAAPCATFQLAHDASASANILITCLDSGNFGSVTITKALTLDCGSQDAYANNITVNGNGSTIVRIRGLKMNGAGNASGLAAITFTAGAALFLENCIITNYNGSTPVAVSFTATAGNATRLSITDSVIKNNFSFVTPANGGGIFMQTSGNGSIRAVIERTQIVGNGTGIRGVGNSAGANGFIGAVVTDSAISSHYSNGVVALTQGGFAPVSISLERTILVANVDTGLVANGQGAYGLLSGSTLLANGLGLAGINAGAIYSYKNNVLTGNFVDAMPTGTSNLN